MGTLTVELLGSMRISNEQEAVIDFESDASRALLAYLAVSPERPVPREVLAGLLWPEGSDADALRNLRATLYRLRNAIRDRQVDPPYLLISRSAMQLNVDSDIWVDLHAVNEHLRWVSQHASTGAELDTASAERLTAAGELYRGDFMAGFSYPSAEFEGWLVTQRESLHVRMLDVLSRLAAFHEQRGGYRESLAYARRQIELEPWREGAHRQAMRALALIGQRATALAQYESCARILDEELGIEPEAATKELYEQINRGDLSPPVHAPVVGPAMPAPILGVDAVPQNPVMPHRQSVAQEMSTPHEPISSPITERSSDLPTRRQSLIDGERRITSLIVAEMRGTEQLLQREGLEAWATVLQEILGLLQAEVTRYGGTVLQVRHTGLAAAFGVGVAHEDDVQRAVLSALAMVEALRAARDSLPAMVSETTPTVVVTTGDAVVLTEDDGNVTVHTAALQEADRLQTQVPAGVVWVTEAVKRRVQGLFRWQTLEAARGRQRTPAALYRPLAPIPTVGERQLNGLRAPLVGRKTELHALDEAVNRVVGGVGGIVTVVGDAGIGKSRLVAEVRSRFAAPESSVQGKRQPQTGDILAGSGSSLRWVEGRWLSYAQDEAYHGWQELVRQLLGMEEACDVSACDALEARLSELSPELLGVLYPYLARLLNLPIDEATAAQVDAMAAAGLFLEALVKALTVLMTSWTDEQPLVLVLEDIHWADEASIALLDRLLALADQMPLLLIATMRPQRDHGCWRVLEAAARDYGHRHVAIYLDPLSSDERVSLVHYLMAGREDKALDEVVDAIATRADGNPFFTAELVRSLLDQGPTTDELPETVQSVLIARIDRLPTMARRVLQLAAVIGRKFQYQVLADIIATPAGETPSEEINLNIALLQLVRAQMVREYIERPDFPLHVDRGYVFEHQLTLEVAYNSLLQRKWSVLHHRVADALERLYPEQVEGHLGLLAHHWERAGDAERAVSYLQRAGRQAASQYANSEAIGYYDRALALVPEGDTDLRYDLLLNRERLYRLTGELGGQIRDLLSLEALADRLADAHKQAEVAIRRSEQEVFEHHPELAQRAAEKAVQLATSAGDVELEAQAYLRLAEAWAEPGTASDRAYMYLSQVLDLAQSEGLHRLEAEALYAMGVNVDCDRHLVGRAQLQRVLAIYREAGDRLAVGRLLGALANLHGYCGDYAQARAIALQAVDVLAQIGDRHEEGLRRIALGYYGISLGLYSEALEHLSLGREYNRRAGSSAYESWAAVLTGVAFDSLGDYAQARSVLEGVLALPAEHVGLVPRAWALAQLALLLLHQGNAPGAGAGAQHAIDFAAGTGAFAPYGWLPQIRAMAHMVRGHALGVLKDDRGAIDAYRDALDVERKAGPPGTPAEARAGMARVYLRREEYEAALAEVEQILRYLETGHLQGTMEPLRILLTCYHVLEAHDDPRATAILSEAYRELMASASAISDERLRRSFMEQIEVNREVAVLGSAHTPQSLHE